MLKTKSKILLILFLVSILVSSYCFATIEPRTSEPQGTSENEPITTSENETNEISSTTTEEENPSWTNGDLYIYENKVTISNVVDGNAFVIGKEVTVTGEIGGDLFVLADKLNIEGGYVYSSIFACANEITINGVVYDVYATCNNFNLESNGFIYRDMKVTASNVNMNGKVRRDAYIYANTLNFKEDAGTIIYGNLDFSTNSQINVPEGVVTGEIIDNSTTTKTEKSIFTVILSYMADLIRTLLFTFVIIIILLWLTPKFIERVESMNVAKSFISLGIGFLTPFALIIVGLLLIISSIGISIFICGMFAFIVLAYIGFAITSIFFGKLFAKLLKLEGKIKFILLTLAISAILWLICQIPILGVIFSFIISIFGIGTTLVNMVWRKENTTNEIKE